MEQENVKEDFKENTEESIEGRIEGDRKRSREEGTGGRIERDRKGSREEGTGGSVEGGRKENREEDTGRNGTGDSGEGIGGNTKEVVAGTGKKNKMETMPVPKLVITVSLPLMISLLVQSLYNIVDGIYVARISENALAATSLAYPIQLLMVAVSVGTGVGINSHISRKIGAKKFEEVDLAATTGLLLSLLSSVFFMIVGFLFTGSFFGLYTTDRELISLGTKYLQICTTFSQGIFIATMGERILQSTGNTLHSMIAQVAGAVVNVVLDPILIFGMLGLPKMGIAGAAIATVIGQWAAAALSILLVLKRGEVHFIFKKFRWDGSIVKDIYKVGCPSMFVQAMGSVMMMGVNNVLLGFSATAVSFFGIYYKLQNFAFMPVSGLAQGLIPIVYVLAKLLTLNTVWHAFWITSVIAMIYCIIVLRSVYQKKIRQIL